MGSRMDADTSQLKYKRFYRWNFYGTAFLQLQIKSIVAGMDADISQLKYEKISRWEFDCATFVQLQIKSN